MNPPQRMPANLLVFSGQYRFGAARERSEEPGIWPLAANAPRRKISPRNAPLICSLFPTRRTRACFSTAASRTARNSG